MHEREDLRAARADKFQRLAQLWLEGDKFGGVGKHVGEEAAVGGDARHLLIGEVGVLA